MRETIVEMIPNFVYADPRGVSMLEESTDAFGIAMKVRKSCFHTHFEQFLE